MNAVLSNKHYPHYGVATIPLPIPKENYDHTIEVLEALEIGSAVSSDCRVEEIWGEPFILRRLEGTCANVDELDYLVKRLDSFDKRELAQFGALCVSQDVQDIADFINLTFCCQSTPMVQDFTDLEKTGLFCYMERNGGALLSDEQGLDFKREALNLILNEDGKVTPYGVIYDSGFQMEQFYDGQHFPQGARHFCGNDRSLRSGAPRGRNYVPPRAPSSLRRGLEAARAIANMDGIQLRFLDSNLPEEADATIRFEHESVSSLNDLCGAVAKLDAGDLEKLGAVVCFAKPSDAAALQHLAEHLDSFDFVPGIDNAADYGRHMICASGRFEYDDNLAGYYNFEKYGKEHIEQADGEFNHRGYVGYHGFLSMEELMAGMESERMEFEMGRIS